MQTASTATCSTPLSPRASTPTRTTGSGQPHGISTTPRPASSEGPSEDGSWDTWKTAPRGDLVAEIESRYRWIVEHKGKEYRTCPQLELESAWNRILEYIWTEFEPERFTDWLHVECFLKRQLGWWLTIERRTRGKIVGNGERGILLLTDITTGVAEDIDDYLEQFAHRPGNADEPTRSQAVLRVAHPSLGSCRIDLSAAYDQLTAAKQDALRATLIAGIRAIEIDEATGRYRSATAITRHKAILELRAKLSGQFIGSRRTDGGRIIRKPKGVKFRYVPLATQRPGYKWVAA